MRIASVLLLLAWCQLCYAQGVSYESLKLNSSPAYNVLGVEPVNIQRPNTPMDFIAGVQSAVVNGKLQPNFALETTPYYWFNKKGAAKSSGGKLSPLLYMTDNWRNNIVRSFTFSLASSESDSFTFGKIVPGTGYAAGIHFTIFSSRLNKETARLLYRRAVNFDMDLMIEEVAGLLKSAEHPPEKFAYRSMIRKWVSAKLKNKKDYRDQAAELLALMDQEFNGRPISLDELKQFKLLLEEDATMLLEEINSVRYPLTRDGFSLDFAMAASGIFQASRFDSFQFAKMSIWLTPSYRFISRNDPKNIFDVMTVIRLTFNDALVDTANYFEAGLRLQQTWNKFSLSGEAVGRYLTSVPAGYERGYTWRYDLSMDYKVNDFITFRATFGANFDGNSTHYTDPKKMFAVGGFNFGFGSLFDGSR